MTKNIGKSPACTSKARMRRMKILGCNGLSSNVTIWSLAFRYSDQICTPPGFFSVPPMLLLSSAVALLRLHL